MIQRDYEYALRKLTGHNHGEVWSMYNVQRLQRYENYPPGGTTCVCELTVESSNY